MNKISNIAQIEYLESIEKERFSLDVHMCQCGFYFGVDCTFLDQVGNIKFVCPSCDRTIEIEAYDD